MKKKKFSSILIYLFCCALVLLTYMSYVYTPLSKTINELDQKHNQIQAQINEYQLQAAQKDKLVSHIQELKTQVEASQNAEDAITDKNVEEDIETACKTAGVNIQSLNLSTQSAEESKTSEEGRPLLSLTIDLQITCTEAQLQQVLNYFEQESKGAYYVNHVSLRKDASVPNAMLSMSLYYFAAQETKE